MRRFIKGQHNCKTPSTVALCSAQEAANLQCVHALLAISYGVFERDAACCLAKAVGMTKQQALKPTCCRWLYKGILEANDEGVNEPA